MSDTARDYQTSFPASVEGLDDLFADATQCEAIDLHCESDATHCEYTIAEASNALKVSPSTVYRRIKAGKYQAVTDSEGVLKVLMPRIASQREAAATQFEASATQCEAVELQREAVASHENELAKAFVEMSNKLQHATYRNGWLESKLEELQKDVEQRDQAIKLLTDSQHKPAWWRRFYSWFIGR
ncbi:MAG: hypothetical protein C0507_14920 [Cyanobacteria bacterium PR.3.49]|nr:hypothetical protein [Cyanobacteria bacterium PR.3.49]